jgi:hypothetical protein
MATQNLAEPLKVGTVVKIRNSGYPRAKIAEVRGPLGPNGVRIYRVLVERKPRRVSSRSEKISLRSYSRRNTSAWSRTVGNDLQGQPGMRSEPSPTPLAMEVHPADSYWCSGVAKG